MKILIDLPFGSILNISPEALYDALEASVLVAPVDGPGFAHDMSGNIMLDGKPVRLYAEEVA
jgi:hypothetical protein